MKNKWCRIACPPLSLALAVLLVVFLPQIVQALTGKRSPGRRSAPSSPRSSPLHDRG